MAAMAAPGPQVHGQVRVAAADLEAVADLEVGQHVVDQEVGAFVEAEGVKVDTRQR
jgi:hypothetical protein